MNLEQFNGFLNSPATLNAQSLPLLTELVKEYPYFQTAQVLLAKNLHNEKNIRYNAQLKIAAAYSTDRKKLFELIKGIAQVEENLIQPVIVKLEKPIQPKEEKKEIQQEKTVLKPIERVKSEEPLVKKKEEAKVESVIEKKVEPVAKKQQPKPDETHTFTEWLRLASIHSVKAVEIEREKKKPSQKDVLIDKFLREEPKISKPQKAEFFSPVTMAKQSIIEDDDLVTETLAQIYEKQGFFAKAIKAYEKLSLKYPEKKHSFAARIENLTQKLNEQ
jgi:tetratricopeptide (TPR) repeat protein